MNDTRGKTAEVFSQAADPALAPSQNTQSTPEMIREDQPMPRPTPPGLGTEIDSQNFDQRWNEAVRAYGRNEPDSQQTFDPLLAAQFDQASDPLDQITQKERSRGLSR